MLYLEEASAPLASLCLESERKREDRVNVGVVLRTFPFPSLEFDASTFKDQTGETDRDNEAT